MNLTIYKYLITTVQRQSIFLPLGGRILTVQTQYEKPCVWALVDEFATVLVEHRLRIFGTGRGMINEDMTYVGTYQTDGGSFIWHLFEEALPVAQ